MNKWKGWGAVVILELAVVYSEQEGSSNVANVWEQPTSYFDFIAVWYGL